MKHFTVFSETRFARTMFVDQITPREDPVEIDGVINGVDKELVNLVKAMNKFPGIRTIESCAGHGNKPPAIWFQPDSIEDLPALLYWFDRCHSGCYWPVRIYTDCSADHVTWMVKARVDGEEAYQEADKIAEYMERYIDEQSQPEEGCAIG
ncbi:hypothetical protein LCGC14_0874180 [marine sediment metagenome]|uniref:Uncharacterized protein n=1 Tax=marine sediment metagenome TaxID=412755 RepID=A0A0F9PPH4_9ZZZZ